MDRPRDVPTWDQFFLGHAKAYAARSKDPSTQIGAIIVGPNQEIRAGGYNGLPRGIDDSVLDRYQRPLKYSYFEHAERNAIFNAARIGTPTDGCRMYISGPMPPCSNCARAIIQSGIRHVICESIEYLERWAEEGIVAMTLFKEARVDLWRIKS